MRRGWDAIVVAGGHNGLVSGAYFARAGARTLVLEARERVGGAADLTRLFSMSIADLLDRWFESDEVKGAVAAGGVIGTWAGPAEPGTAYVLLHTALSDVEGGSVESWGYPRGGMGAVANAIRRSAESAGCEIRRASSCATSSAGRPARAR